MTYQALGYETASSQLTAGNVGLAPDRVSNSSEGNYLEHLWYTWNNETNLTLTTNLSFNKTTARALNPTSLRTSTSTSTQLLTPIPTLTSATKPIPTLTPTLTPMTHSTNRWFMKNASANIINASKYSTQMVSSSATNATTMTTTTTRMTTTTTVLTAQPYALALGSNYGDNVDIALIDSSKTLLDGTAGDYAAVGFGDGALQSDAIKSSMGHGIGRVHKVVEKNSTIKQFYDGGSGSVIQKEKNNGSVAADKADGGSSFMLLFEDFGEYFYNYNGSSVSGTTINSSNIAELFNRTNCTTTINTTTCFDLSEGKSSA